MACCRTVYGLRRVIIRLSMAVARFAGIRRHYRPDSVLRYTIIQAFLFSLCGLMRFKKICSKKFLFALVMVHHER